MATPLSNKLDWDLANPIWASTLNPVIANPLNCTHILENILLIVGINIINHGLGKNMQGWFFTDQDRPANVNRSAPMNSTTLTLTSDAIVKVNIGVF